MALASYADLKAAIAAWNFNRASLPAGDFVALAEARLNRDLKLRLMETETDLTPTVGSRLISLPEQFAEPIALFVDYGAGRQTLTFVAAGMETLDAAGPPGAWTIDGANAAFDRPLDHAYDLTLRFVQRFALSDSDPANWLLETHPDLYLAACNIEAALYNEEDDQLARWQARYGEAVAALNAQESRSRSPAGLVADAGLRQPRPFDIVRG